MMINTFKITTILFGLLNLGLCALWFWDSNMMEVLFGIEIVGDRNLIPYFFLALGAFSLASSALHESRSRVIFLLVILLISFIALVANLQYVLEGELKGMAFITVSLMVLGLTGLWGEHNQIDKIEQ